MKVRIWNEQADLFEMSVLEQTAEPIPGTLGDLGEEESLPVLLIGRALTPERLAAIRALSDAVFRSRRSLVITPPFGDLDVGRYLDAPTAVRLLRRKPDSIVKLLDDGLRSSAGAELTIRSDHNVETALGAGLVATDSSGKPILVRYQPRNTSGAAFVSGVQLLSYTALSVEEHRQALLSGLMGWRNAGAAQRAVATAAVTPQSIPPDDITGVLLALAASESVEPARLSSVAETFLDLSLDERRVGRVLGWLEADGVLSRGAEGDLRILPDALQAVVERSGLHAYARELREMAREHPEVPR